jgi:hypothetical protein
MLSGKGTMEESSEDSRAHLPLVRRKRHPVDVGLLDDLVFEELLRLALVDDAFQPPPTLRGPRGRGTNTREVDAFHGCSV